MRVYRIFANEEPRQFLVPVSDDDVDALADWPQPIQVELVTENRGRKLLPTDFPWLEGHVPAFSERAVDALRPTLEQHGRLVPLVSAPGRFFGLHVTGEIDALDLEHSTLIRFPSSGRVMHIATYSFRPSAIAGRKIFRIPQLGQAGWVYVTDAYVDEVLATGLDGASFDLLWSNDGRNRGSRV